MGKCCQQSLQTEAHSLHGRRARVHYLAALCSTWPRGLLLLFIRAYRLFISPFLGPSCRFEPSCSHYAEQAITTYGAIKGTLLIVRRLGRCHPWSKGGYDPLPQQDETECSVSNK